MPPPHTLFLSNLLDNLLMDFNIAVHVCFWNTNLQTFCFYLKVIDMAHLFSSRKSVFFFGKHVVFPD